MRLLSLLLLLELFFSNSAHALRQYRCDGWVQYRPCDQEFSTSSPKRPELGLRREARAMYRVEGARFARITTESFVPYSPREGIWKGRVEGNGDIHLQLNIFRNGNHEDSRYMGHVTLMNKSTSFKFRSSVPVGANWTWKITAEAV